MNKALKYLLAVAVVCGATIAQAEEITCPDLYCWLPLQAGITKTCTVKYEFATGRCRSACNGASILSSSPGDTYTKICPGIPGMHSYCVAYFEQQPVPSPDETGESLPDFLYTTSEGEGGCAYWPAE